MAWVFLVIALGLTAGVLIITYGYRTSIIVLLVVLLLGIGGVIWYAEFYQGSSASLIATEEVALDNFSVRSTYGSSFEMFARLSNKSSKHVLTAVGVELSASDCVAQEGEETCVIVGQQETEIQKNVPTQQARDIRQQFIFPPMRPQGKLKWSYSILYTRAEK